MARGLFISNLIFSNKNLIIWLFVLNSACKFGNESVAYHMPAEFEKQESLWMSCVGVPPFMKIRAQVLNEIEPKIMVHIVAASDSLLSVCSADLNSNHVSQTEIKYLNIIANEFWMRDHGPVFVVDKNHEHLKYIDFEWNQYGYKGWLQEYYNGNDSLINLVMSTLNIAEKEHVDSLIGASIGLSSEKTWINIEGGTIEVNGKGTLILNQPLTLQRNIGKSKEQLENEFKRVLGVSHIIWLGNGLAEDPHIIDKISNDFIAIGTGGHTDEFVRFADPSTILIAWVQEDEVNLNPVNKINASRMSENFKILSQSTDQDGKAFRIIKIPMPNIVYQKIRINENNVWDSTLNIPEIMFKPQDKLRAGDSINRIASASYLNYFLTNDEIVLPTYVHVGTSDKKEQQVRQLFKEAFPTRRQVMINALPLNWRGGGLHCSVLNQPAVKQKN